MPFSSFFSFSLHVRRTKEMGSNAAQLSTNFFNSVRHSSTYKIYSNGRQWREQKLCWKPKGRMHIIETSTIKLSINHNTNNTSGYKFTSTREKKIDSAYKQFSFTCNELMSQYWGPLVILFLCIELRIADIKFVFAGGGK